MVLNIVTREPAVLNHFIRETLTMWADDSDDEEAAPTPMTGFIFKGAEDQESDMASPEVHCVSESSECARCPKPTLDATSDSPCLAAENLGERGRRPTSLSISVSRDYTLATTCARSERLCLP